MGKKSAVWRYFTEENNEIKCNVTGCPSPSVKRSTKATTNLWVHLETNHSDVYNGIKSEKLPPTNKRKSTADESQASNLDSTQKRMRLDAETAIMKMLARRNVPFTLVDDPLFKQMAEKAFKNVKHRSSQYYAVKVLPTVANNILEKLRQEIGDRHFSITTDGWSALNKPSPSFYR